MTPIDVRAPGALEGLPRRLRLFLSLAACIRCGTLTIRLPDGRTFRAAGEAAGPVADIAIHRLRMVRRLFLGGSVGFGESYMDGDWSTTDLAPLLALAAYNEDHLGNVHAAGLAQELGVISGVF